MAFYGEITSSYILRRKLHLIYKWYINVRRASRWRFGEISKILDANQLCSFTDYHAREDFELKTCARIEPNVASTDASYNTLFGNRDYMVLWSKVVHNAIVSQSYRIESGTNYVLGRVNSYFNKACWIGDFWSYFLNDPNKHNFSVKVRRNNKDYMKFSFGRNFFGNFLNKFVPSKFLEYKHSCVYKSCSSYFHKLLIPIGLIDDRVSFTRAEFNYCVYLGSSTNIKRTRCINFCNLLLNICKNLISREKVGTWYSIARRGFSTIFNTFSELFVLPKVLVNKFDSSERNLLNIVVSTLKNFCSKELDVANKFCINIDNITYIMDKIHCYCESFNISTSSISSRKTFVQRKFFKKNKRFWKFYFLSNRWVNRKPLRSRQKRLKSRTEKRVRRIKRVYRALVLDHRNYLKKLLLCNNPNDSKKLLFMNRFVNNYVSRNLISLFKLNVKLYFLCDYKYEFIEHALKLIFERITARKLGVIIEKDKVSSSNNLLITSKFRYYKISLGKWVNKYVYSLFNKKTYMADSIRYNDYLEVKREVDIRRKLFDPSFKEVSFGPKYLIDPGTKSFKEVLCQE